MELFSEHFKKDNVFLRVDARVKILVALTVLIMVLSYRGFTLPLLVALFCLSLCIKMRIPLKVFMLRFSEPLFIAFVVMLLKLFFSGEDVLFSANLMGIGIVGYKDGLMDGLRIASRI